jgi:hypothetical protein
MSLKLNSSGGGSVTLQEPSTASNLTLTLPTTTGTAVIQNASNNLLMNSGYGSDAVAYGCRAWVNFNGTGTVAIRASGNVSSITDSGTGAYTVNFTTALADANYAGVIMTGTYQALASNDAAAPTTTAFAFISRQSSSPATSLDSAYLHVAIFR